MSASGIRTEAAASRTGQPSGAAGTDVPRMSVAFRALLAVASCLPIRLGRAVGSAAGWLAFQLIGSLRRRALDSIAIAFGSELSEEARHDLGKATLMELGMTLFEFMKMPSLEDRELLRLIPVDGEQHIRPLAGKPAIFISGHIGNVVMLGAAMTLRGFPVTTVVRPFTNPSLRALVFAVSKRFHLGVIERSGTRVGLQSLEILRSGQVLGLVGDQDAGSKGIFVDFFGRPASTFLGPVQLARHLHLPVVPMFCLRHPDGSLTARVEPPMAMQQTGRKEIDDAINTARHVALLEAVVRRYPACYLWLHRRWKTRPPVTPSAEPDSPPAARP